MGGHQPPQTLCHANQRKNADLLVLIRQCWPMESEKTLKPRLRRRQKILRCMKMYHVCINQGRQERALGGHGRRHSLLHIR